MEVGDARDGALLELVGTVPWLLPSRWQGWGVLWGVLSTEDRFSWLRGYRSYSNAYNPRLQQPRWFLAPRRRTRSMSP